jgi:hypothetical protein
MENLDSFPQLDTLNLSKNFLKSIDNLSGLKSLNSLIVSHNRIEALDGVRAILDCPTLRVLDLQHNRVEDGGILDLLAQMPDLRVVYLQGNPCIKNIKSYRKTMIARLVHLTHLDDRPVFPDERRTAEAWFRGGLDAEKAERELIVQEKEDREQRNFDAFSKLITGGRTYEERMGLPPLPASASADAAVDPDMAAASRALPHDDKDIFDDDGDEKEEVGSSSGSSSGGESSGSSCFSAFSSVYRTPAATATSVFITEAGDSDDDESGSNSEATVASAVAPQRQEGEPDDVPELETVTAAVHAASISDEHSSSAAVPPQSNGSTFDELD